MFFFYIITYFYGFIKTTSQTVSLALWMCRYYAMFFPPSLKNDLLSQGDIYIWGVCTKTLPFRAPFLYARSTVCNKRLQRLLEKQKFLQDWDAVLFCEASTHKLTYSHTHTASSLPSFIGAGSQGIYMSTVTHWRNFPYVWLSKKTEKALFCTATLTNSCL